MRRLIARLGLGSCLLFLSTAVAQERKATDDGPRQYATHDGFVWKAWATKGQRPALFVEGILKKAGGPGQIAHLAPASPQGINRNILILEVKLGQLPGEWPEPLVDLPAGYQKAGYRGDYDSVTVRFKDGSGVDLRVNDGGPGEGAGREASEGGAKKAGGGR